MTTAKQLVRDPETGRVTHIIDVPVTDVAVQAPAKRHAAKMPRQTARDLADVMRTFSRTKTFSARITKSPSDGSGTFVAIVSTFGPPPDEQGDIVARHAFDETITQAYVDHPGALWPVYWMHSYEDPANAIGTITAASATPNGLVVEGRLAVDTNERALEVYRGMLEDRIREWSISYGIVAEHADTWNDQRVNVLDELELLEISAVMAGANRHTRTVSVKSRDPEPQADSELARYNRVLDGLASGRAKSSDPDVVDQFVREDRELHARERAEEAARQQRLPDRCQLDVVADGTSAEEMSRMLNPALWRFDRDAEVDTDA